MYRSVWSTLLFHASSSCMKRKGSGMKWLMFFLFWMKYFMFQARRCFEHLRRPGSSISIAGWEVHVVCFNERCLSMSVKVILPSKRVWSEWPRERQNVRNGEKRPLFSFFPLFSRCFSSPCSPGSMCRCGISKKLWRRSWRLSWSCCRPLKKSTRTGGDMKLRWATLRFLFFSLR